ncbi:MAG: DnaD domain protein [Chloroflexi bacterium]|nr:DnaD domain protein [Chloroflexota bacterium]
MPTLFLSDLLPRIEDLAELKATLQFLRLRAQRRGYPLFVAYRELAADRAAASDGLPEGLEAAVRRGTLLHLPLEVKGKREDLYFLNTESDRYAVARIQAGELPLGRIVAGTPVEPRKDIPTIFALYEKNIGLLTPMVADELKEADQLYPAAWIEDAFREAVELNKRSWRYIARILERWAREGRSGKPGRDSQSRQDPNYYFKGKYAHLIKR